MAAAQVKRVVSDDAALCEVLVGIVSEIYRHVDTKFAAQEEKINALQSAMEQLRFVPWSEGQQYRKGNICSLGGSLFFCNRDTQSRPGVGTDWLLLIPKPRDGRDATPPQEEETR